MTREEYFICLESYLKNLSYEEFKEAIKYYEDYFDEAGPENEQDVIEKLGSPKQLAETILSSEGVEINSGRMGQIDEDVTQNTELAKVTPVESYENQNNQERTDYAEYENAEEEVSTESRVLRIVVAVIIIVVGFPIIIGAISTAFGIAIGLGFGGLGLVIAGIAGFVGGILLAFTTGAGMGIMIIGITLVLLAIGLLMLFAIYAICRYFVPLCVRGIKKVWKYVVG